MTIAFIVAPSALLQSRSNIGDPARKSRDRRALGGMATSCSRLPIRLATTQPIRPSSLLAKAQSKFLLACTTFRCLGQRLLDSLWSERRVTQANAGELHNRVRYRGRDQRRRHLAGTSGMVFGLYHLDVHRRHLVHAWDAVVVEIRLFHHAVLDRDALAQRDADAIDDAAFGLRHDIVRLHRNAAVDCAPEIVQLDLPTGAIERHLGDTGDLRARIVDIGEPERAAVTLAPPLRHLRYALDCFVGARRVLEQLKAERERIDAALARDLVDECLSRELVGQEADST